MFTAYFRAHFNRYSKFSSHVSNTRVKVVESKSSRTFLTMKAHLSNEYLLWEISSEVACNASWADCSKRGMATTE